AHSAAIDAGGKTIAVLGTPLEQFFPASNRSLQERIMREHLAISQFSKAGGAKNFPMRNRTMALLTEATVIVEAGEKSGTVHQVPSRLLRHQARGSAASRPSSRSARASVREGRLRSIPWTGRRIGTRSGECSARFGWALAGRTDRESSCRCEAREGRASV